MTSFLNRLKIRIFVPMNKVTDIDLQWYEAVRQDNYPAFEKLFQKYYDPLCRYAQGLLADGSLAEDVVQDMFIHFWENRIKLQVKDSLRASSIPASATGPSKICKNRPLSGNITRN